MNWDALVEFLRMVTFQTRSDFAAQVVLASFALYSLASPVFWMSGRPWFAVMYFGYTVGAMASFMLALGYR